MSTPAFGRTLEAAAPPPLRSHHAALPEFHAASDLPLPPAQHTYYIYQYLSECLIVCSLSCCRTAYQDNDIDHILNAKIMQQLPTNLPINVPATRLSGIS